MPYKWPADTDFALWELDVIDRACPVCGRMMYICDHRYRRLHTLDGPVQLVCKLNHCPDRLCPGRAGPRVEHSLASLRASRFTAIGGNSRLIIIIRPAPQTGHTFVGVTGESCSGVAIGAVRLLETLVQRPASPCTTPASSCR